MRVGVSLDHGVAVAIANGTEVRFPETRRVVRDHTGHRRRHPERPRITRARVRGREKRFSPNSRQTAGSSGRRCSGLQLSLQMREAEPLLWRRSGEKQPNRSPRFPVPRRVIRDRTGRRRLHPGRPRITRARVRGTGIALFSEFPPNGGIQRRTQPPPNSRQTAGSSGRRCSGLQLSLQMREGELLPGNAVAKSSRTVRPVSRKPAGLSGTVQAAGACIRDGPGSCRCVSGERKGFKGCVWNDHGSRGRVSGERELRFSPNSRRTAGSSGRRCSGLQLSLQMREGVSPFTGVAAAKSNRTDRPVSRKPAGLSGTV